MAGKVRIEFDAQAQRAIQEFDKLTKAQQKLVVQGSKVGKEFDKVEKKAKRAGKNAQNAFGRALQSKLRANVDVLTLFSKGVQVLNSELERTKRLNKEAFDVQGGTVAAIGSLQANTGFTKAQTQRVIASTGTIAGQTGLNQADLINAITDAASRAGASNFTLKQILSALRESSFTGAVDRDVDLGELTAANLRLQAIGFSEREASNFAKVFVQQFGGKLNEAAKQFPSLIETAKGAAQFEKARFGKATTTTEDIFAVFGALTQGPVPDTEQAATLTRSLFGKVNVAKFDFKSQGARQRLVEISNALQSGQIKDEDIIKTFTSAGAKGSLALPAFAFFGGAQQNIQQRASQLQRVRGAKGNIGRQQFQQFLSLPQAQTQFDVARSRAQLESSQFQDVEAGRRAAVLKLIADIKKRERTGFLADPFQKFREAGVAVGTISEERALSQVRERGSRALRAGDLSIDPRLAGAPVASLVEPIIDLTGKIEALTREFVSDRKDKKAKELGTPPGEE